MRVIPSSWSEGAILVCTHQRGPEEKPSCGLERGSVLREFLKQRVRDEGLKGRILTAKTGCLGICSALGATVEFVPASETGRPRATLLCNPETEAEAIWEAAKQCLLKGEKLT